MLIIGLLFLRFRVRGVSSFRWRSLVSVWLHGFLSGRVLFCFLHILYVCSDILFFRFFYFILRRQDLTNAMSACFLFLLFLYLPAYCPGFHLGAFLSYLGFGVEGLGCSLGLYCYVRLKGRVEGLEFHLYFQDILTYFHYSSFPSFLLGVIEKWVAFEIYGVRMASGSRHNCCQFASYIYIGSSRTLLEATLGLLDIYIFVLR